MSVSLSEEAGGSYTKAFVKHITVYKEYYIELSTKLLY